MDLTVTQQQSKACNLVDRGALAIARLWALVLNIPWSFRISKIGGRVGKHQRYELHVETASRTWGYCAEMKVRDVLILLNREGWYLTAVEGSHRQYKHPTKAGRVTVSGKPNDDLPPGTLNSILRQAGLKD